ncbi:hypothetical protein F444_00249 [Phytophthora nicotianae P1976]|uniref:Uncharacterized protein n=2 Tax=Phytophthora nicotianae TaxID=4792 RepID=A0A081B4W4_PHYNI|nr:hypothetical protein F444_00249 [Phytophthora nicotianae P1976]
MLFKSGRINAVTKFFCRKIWQRCIRRYLRAVENEDGEDDEVEDICDFDMRELDEADEDDGMEFHDSNVGLDFKLQDLNLQDYQGLDELEEGDEEFDEDVEEEIHT